mmetsp:Transcript_34563/g.73784  ORF Transcript_34563/g.73784 Transcript_34563/m.73784 type:complete len:213 (-) Transcript_34563:283-921(-)|eukprot:CAMPEP_0183360688 /NCGR_PEP_ID=MMETSP0164_2-20130417/55900_1 /TAXON_ID=221442 /ORGANISM="Coccolithus pelagicus ssp braarudi, Strain PLY182g" /LENGTH=212 /DNA_ID=CAMNT_0025535109 /DNA_START=7 /DNA_END=645 /DNA_ORIENTATION=+
MATAALLAAAVVNAYAPSASHTRGTPALKRTLFFSPHALPQPRVLPIMMARWSLSDARGKGLPLPAEVEELLSDDTPRDQVQIMWAAMRGCYATEADAVAAVERNTGTILPYLNSPSNIRGSYAYLTEIFGPAGARVIVTKNPGVLSCDPRALRQTSAEEIEKAANLVDSVENLPIPLAVRNNLDKIIFFIGAAIIYTRLVACTGQSCGFSG